MYCNGKIINFNINLNMIDFLIRIFIHFLYLMINLS